MAEPESQRTAYRWFKRAADNGHLPATYSVGVCHLKGRGVNEDPIQAYRWFWPAAGEGYDSAERALEKLERKLDPATLARGRGIQTPGPRGNIGANRVDGGLAASGSSSGSFSSQRSTS